MWVHPMSGLESRHVTKSRGSAEEHPGGGTGLARGTLRMVWRAGCELQDAGVERQTPPAAPQTGPAFDAAAELGPGQGGFCCGLGGGRQVTNLRGGCCPQSCPWPPALLRIRSRLETPFRAEPTGVPWGQNHLSLPMSSLLRVAATCSSGAVAFWGREDKTHPQHQHGVRSPVSPISPANTRQREQGNVETL